MTLIKNNLSLIISDNKCDKTTPLIDSDNDPHYLNYINLNLGGKNG